MCPRPPPVKTRRYDASRRRAAEQANRDRVLAAARERFLADGYAATTVARVASDAGVSVESVYRLGGGKAGLVRSLCEDALLGTGPEPAEERSDRLQAEAGSAAEVVQGWADLVAEISPRVSPLHLLVRTAAATDAGLARLLADLDAARLTRMTHNARGLLATRGLKPGVTVEHAAELLWLYTAPEWYERLVLQRGWPLRRYADFVGEAMAAALIELPA